MASAQADHVGDHGPLVILRAVIFTTLKEVEAIITTANVNLVRKTRPWSNWWLCSLKIEFIFSLTFPTLTKTHITLHSRAHNSAVLSKLLRISNYLFLLNIKGNKLYFVRYDIFFLNCKKCGTTILWSKVETSNVLLCATLCTVGIFSFTVSCFKIHFLLFIGSASFTTCGKVWPSLFVQ